MQPYQVYHFIDREILIALSVLSLTTIPNSTYAFNSTVNISPIRLILIVL